MKVDKLIDINLIRNLIQHCMKFSVRHPKIVGSHEASYIADTLNALYSKELKWDLKNLIEIKMEFEVQ